MDQIEDLAKTIDVLKRGLHTLRKHGKVVASKRLAYHLADNITHMYHHICASDGYDHAKLYFYSTDDSDDNLSFKIGLRNYSHAKKLLAKEIARIENMYEQCQHDYLRAIKDTNLYKHIGPHDPSELSDVLLKMGSMVILEGDRGHIRSFNYQSGDFMYGKHECVFGSPKDVLDELAYDLNVIIVIPKYDDIDTAFYIAKDRYRQAISFGRQLPLLEIV